MIEGRRWPGCLGWSAGLSSVDVQWCVVVLYQEVQETRRRDSGKTHTLLTSAPNRIFSNVS